MAGLRWQYLRVLMEQLPPIERLDELGSQGWEAVQKGILPGQVTLYEWLFKRAVFEHPAIVEMAREGVEQETKAEPQPVSPEPAGDTPTARDYVNRLRVSEEVADASSQPSERPKGQWSPEARERARQRGLAQAAKARAARWGEQPAGMGVTHG